LLSRSTRLQSAQGVGPGSRPRASARVLLSTPVDVTPEYVANRQVACLNPHSLFPSAVAKLRSDKNETKHDGSRGRPRLLQAICRVFDEPSVLALLTRRTYAMHRSLPSLN